MINRKTSLIAAILILFAVVINFLLIRQAFLKETDEEVKWIYYSEEHFNIGVTLYNTGSMTVLGQPNVLRLPGYPIYVSGVLHARDFVQGLTREGVKPFYGSVIADMLQDNQHAVVLSQLLVLALAGMVFYLIIRKFTPQPITLLLVAAFLLNPNSLSLVMRVDYSLLDLTCILLLVLFTIPYFEKSKTSLRDLIVLGVILGIANLIRAIFIIFPFFIFGIKLILNRPSWVDQIKQLMILVVAALVVIAPYTYRNYKVTGKFILTGTQGYVELYHISVVNFFQHPEYADYGYVWRDYGLPLFEKATGDHEYLGAKWYQYGDLTRPAYFKEAIRNITTHPNVYLSNVAFNMKTLLLRNLEIWGMKLFKLNESHKLGRNAFYSYLFMTQWLGLLSIMGMSFVKPLRQYRQPILFMALFLLVAYSLVYQDPRYTYIKLPINFLAISFMTGWIWNAFPKLSGKLVSTGISLLILIWGLLPLFLLLCIS